MQNEDPEKKPFPDSAPALNIEESSSNLPAEVVPVVNEDEEHDIDDIVHSTSVEELPENEETDADDVVHRKGLSSESEINPNADPDDLVHGL